MKRVLRVTLILTAGLLVFTLLGFVALRSLPADFLGRRFVEAAQDGALTRARLLLIVGTDINFTQTGDTALHVAAARGDTAFMEFLLQHGASPDLPAKFDETPLYYARSYKHPDAERILLAHGANPDTSHINPP